MSARGSTLRLGVLAAGFAFLYAPIGLLVLYSFNASRLVTVWGGFSTRWYYELAGNEQLLSSVMISLQIAFVSACLSVLLGICAGYALARSPRFRGREGLSLLIYAPVVMPEVITGLALLLLFVAAGFDRGFWTIVIAHTTAGMCFSTIILQARFAELDPSLEEAAMDLGATPLIGFMTITLPICAPAVAAAFLLAFTISFDDFVLASFTSGPGSTTLPMRIYSQVRLGLSPQINAVSTLMIVSVALMLLAVRLLSLRQPR